MNIETTSTNPVVRAVIGGTAPRPARVAASRGILPLPQTDLLEILVALAQNGDEELSANARESLKSQDRQRLTDVVSAPHISPQVLAYFAVEENLPFDAYEAIITNLNTPDTAIIKFARQTRDGSLLELVTLNQQRLIRTPQIIDAIISNPYRTAEAERRAQETKREFFQKERGAQQIASELRAQGLEAAAEFIEQAEFAENLQASALTVDDALFIASHIEVPDTELDDSWLSSDLIEEFYEETDEQRQAILGKILGELRMENDEISGERISMLNRILRMSMKDRVKLAMKGDREARNILIRDPNRIVAQAVMQNPRITEHEVEKIASMRTVPEDVLRQIATSRQWSRIYTIVHNLARNPRTPLSNVMGILTRLQLRDLMALSKNRNVSDAVRRQASRIMLTRKGG
ncbi:MAG TPA: hypothetical protein VK400_07865 [Pyrinomonadaceae bacterium]|nr:hypothetical protein [Pyrinomonadaceae bacterium]